MLKEKALTLNKTKVSHKRYLGYINQLAKCVRANTAKNKQANQIKAYTNERKKLLNRQSGEAEQ